MRTPTPFSHKSASEARGYKLLRLTPMPPTPPFLTQLNPARPACRLQLGSQAHTHPAHPAQRLAEHFLQHYLRTTMPPVGVVTRIVAIGTFATATKGHRPPPSCCPSLDALGISTLPAAHGLVDILPVVLVTDWGAVYTMVPASTCRMSVYLQDVCLHTCRMSVFL